MKKRLDKNLFDRGLVASRSQANDLVERAHVYVDGKLTHYSGYKILSRARLSVAPDAKAKYVSRGALKLKAALDAFAFNVQGLVVLDAGSSTSGERGSSYRTRAF